MTATLARHRRPRVASAGQTQAAWSSLHTSATAILANKHFIHRPLPYAFLQQCVHSVEHMTHHRRSVALRIPSYIAEP